MHSTVSASILLSVLATSALAAVHSVQVGPGLSYTPDTVTAEEGDWVEFTFGAGHDVVQSSFDGPCVPLASGLGVYSGFPSGGEVWRFQVNDTNPIWLYCSVPGHCQGGMSMVVNPPSANASRTLDAYQSASADANSEAPDTPQGGVFGAASDDDSTSSDSSSSATASASASASASATSSGTTSASETASETATGTSAGSSETGNVAPANLAASGMMFAGMVAAGVAAVL